MMMGPMKTEQSREGEIEIEREGEKRERGTILDTDYRQGLSSKETTER